MNIDDNHIPQTVTSTEKMREKIRNMNKRIADLEVALDMIITPYSAPDDLLERGMVCGLTSSQQAGIVIARRLLNET